MPPQGSNPFERAKKWKAKLTKDFDAFERDIAPTLAMERYKQEYYVAVDALSKAEARLNSYLRPGDTMPTDKKLREELEFRRKMNVDSDKLLIASKKLVAEFTAHRQKHDEDCNRKREAIANKLRQVFPEVRDDLLRLETKIQGELNILSVMNSQLIVENGELKAAAGQNLGANEMSERFKEILEAKVEPTSSQSSTSADFEEKNQQLMSLQLEYQHAQNTWESTKTMLDSRIKQLETKREEIIDERVENKAEIKRSEKEMSRLQQVNERAETKLESAEQERRGWDDKLNSNEPNFSRNGAFG